MQFNCIKKKSKLEPQISTSAKNKRKNIPNQKPDNKKIETPVYSEYKSSSPSLKNIGQNKVEESKPKIKENEPIAKNQPKQIFSIDELKTAWLRYAEKIKDKLPRMYQLMISHIPDKESDTQIHINLNSESQKKDLQEKVHLPLLGFLKEELNNYSIELTIKITEEVKTENLIYTEKDKFKYLSEKNPELETLKKKFNLDFE